MPNYTFQCYMCDNIWEVNVPIAERHDQRCASCGGRGIQQIEMPMVNFDIKPFVQEHLDEKPVRINSRQDLREKCARLEVKPTYLM